MGFFYWFLFFILKFVMHSRNCSKNKFKDIFLIQFCYGYITHSWINLYFIILHSWNWYYFQSFLIKSMLQLQTLCVFVQVYLYTWHLKVGLLYKGLLAPSKSAFCLFLSQVNLSLFITLNPLARKQPCGAYVPLLHIYLRAHYLLSAKLLLLPATKE